MLTTTDEKVAEAYRATVKMNPEERIVICITAPRGFSARIKNMSIDLFKNDVVQPEGCE